MRCGSDEARRNAGDPGLVLARRLSNAEYNNTIRDLTGADLRPAREFPVDPANQAGFDNSGESLAMSPALLTKYLQAAREVANHMVLQAARASRSRRTRCSSRPIATGTRSTRSSISTSGRTRTTATTSWPRGATSIAPRSAGRRRRSRRLPPTQNVSPKYLATDLAHARGDEGRRSARSRSCRGCGASCRRRRRVRQAATRARRRQDARLRRAAAQEDRSSRTRRSA